MEGGIGPKFWLFSVLTAKLKSLNYAGTCEKCGGGQVFVKDPRPIACFTKTEGMG